MNDEGQNNFIDGLYRNYYNEIAGYCTAILDGDSAEGEDCAQEVFAQAIKDAPKLIKHVNIVGWLRKTAFHRAKRLIRDKSKRKNTEIHITDLSERYVESLQYIEDFDEQFVSDAEIERLKEKVLDSLTADELRLYELRFTQHLTFKDIAPIIGLSESATRMRTVRLELKIRDLVAKLF